MEMEKDKGKGVRRMHDTSFCNFEIRQRAPSRGNSRARPPTRTPFVRSRCRPPARPPFTSPTRSAAGSSGQAHSIHFIYRISQISHAGHVKITGTVIATGTVQWSLEYGTGKKYVFRGRILDHFRTCNAMHAWQGLDDD